MLDLKKQKFIILFLTCIFVMTSSMALAQEKKELDQGRVQISGQNAKELLKKGEIIATINGDVDGDDRLEDVIILGNKFSTDSNYYINLYLVVKDSAEGKLKAAFAPSLSGGYDLGLNLADVTGDGIADVIISAPTGGSGGIISYRVIDFAESIPREIFTDHENQGLFVQGKLLNNYQVELLLGDEPKHLIVDLPNDKNFYDFLGIYNQNGELLSEYYHPYAQGLSGMLVMDTDGDGVAELVTTQRVVGINNTDTIGYIRTVWRYNAIKWQIDSYTFSTKYDNKRSSTTNYSFIGMGGYAIHPKEAVVGLSTIIYPNINKPATGRQYVALNTVIEKYVRAEFEGIQNKGYLNLNYEIKFGGYNFLSIVVFGMQDGINGNQKIEKAFNFNLNTGLTIMPQDLFGKNKKVWAKIKELSVAKGPAVRPENINDYYYDGKQFVFWFNDQETQEEAEFSITRESIENLLNEKEAKLID